MKRTLYLFALLFAVGCTGGRTQTGDPGSGADASLGPDGSILGDASPLSDAGAVNKTDSGAADLGGQDSGGPPVNSADGFGAARTACINEINKLRATEKHAAYALWETPAIDMCVDEQATYDENANSAHDAWNNNVYPTCNGNAQDECLGYGTSPQAIVACLDSMWDERLQSNCSGCAACNGPQLNQQIFDCQSTSTCDFYGKYGGECGHYLNMSADYFTEAACGFSTKSGGSWATQNFR